MGVLRIKILTAHFGPDIFFGELMCWTSKIFKIQTTNIPQIPDMSSSFHAKMEITDRIGHTGIWNEIYDFNIHYDSELRLGFSISNNSNTWLDNQSEMKIRKKVFQHIFSPHGVRQIHSVKLIWNKFLILTHRKRLWWRQMLMTWLRCRQHQNNNWLKCHQHKLLVTVM